MRSDDNYNVETLAQMVATLDYLVLTDNTHIPISSKDEINPELLDKEIIEYFKILNLIANIPGDAQGREKKSVTLPLKYEKFRYLFEKEGAEKLPPYRLGLDHEILLKPDSKPP